MVGVKLDGGSEHPSLLAKNMKQALQAAAGFVDQSSQYEYDNLAHTAL